MMQTRGFNLTTSFKNVSFEKILKTYINTLECEIFPRLFEKIDLPSRSEIKKYELKRPRISKFGEDDYRERHPIRKTILIQEIANLKSQLNGHKINKASELISESYLGGSKEMYESQKLKKGHPTSYEEILEMKIDLSNIFDLMKISKTTVGFGKEIVSFRLDPDNRIDLKFSNEIKNKLLSDSIFLQFINQIEISLHKFREVNKTEFYCSIYLEKDFEVSNINKLILSIDFEKLQLDEKLDLWDTLDNFLRLNIEKSIKYASETDQKKLLELNRNFFTNIELI